MSFQVFPGTSLRRVTFTLRLWGALGERTIPPEFDGANLTENAAKITNLIGLEARYLAWWFRTVACQSIIQDNIHSGGQGKLALFRIEQLPVPLAPIAEQQRIVSAVEALSQRVQLCVRRLSRIPTILKRYRQAVLAAACSGRLTADWRRSRSGKGAARDYLRDLAEARSKAWNDRTNGRRRCPDPVQPESTDLPEIPADWTWASADAICSQITDGEHIQPPYVPVGCPMLSAKHVRDGFVTLDGAGNISEPDFR